MAAKFCKRCGNPLYIPRRQYCAACRRKTALARKRRSGAKRDPRTTSQRGYGTQHQKLRKLLTPKVATGTVRCARCRDLILPGQPWHLDHDDADRSRYRGPAHVDCNCRAGAIKGNRMRQRSRFASARRW